MIEAAMYVALGFCTAGLIGLAILPAFYRRAARLTEEALRAVNPSSYAEVRAAQDQERARHAVEFRRVERQLDAEREKAAKFQLEATSVKLEIEAQKKAHASRIAELETKIAAMQGDQQAIDLLTEEVKTLKLELSDAEKALAASWVETSEEKSGTGTAGSEEDDTGWLPAADTMALTTITGLEAEVATLKAKLARYEPTVAGEVEASRDKAAKSRLAKLEGQLVDTESQYVSAQAEVTRLSMLLESANISETEQQKRLSAQIEKVTGENLRQQAELKARERALERMSGQMVKLQKDLATVPALVELRKDFRALAARLSAAQAVSVAPAPKTTGSGQVTAKPQAGAPQAGSLMKPVQPPTITATSTASVNGVKPADGDPQPSPAEKPVESPAAARTAEIASAAQALVSRIVASQRGKETTVAAEPAGTAPIVQSGQRRSSEPGETSKSSKQKKKDVA
ncbi:hypothetical protein [Roseibium marinum]|uniref:Uncharacterized protein n=1 Tax=Roseibium marinum TaxID=281252 RepID=A0A2S3UL67_9HYPH|nr:hypothetical protein [Roseibium marinum]POF28454.1 hypothetical protein CLV41_11317 [Roseibium marinum]